MRLYGWFMALAATFLIAACLAIVACLAASVFREQPPSAEETGFHMVTLLYVTEEGFLLLADPNTGRQEWISPREAARRWEFPATIRYRTGRHH